MWAIRLLIWLNLPVIGPFVGQRDVSVLEHLSGNSGVFYVGDWPSDVRIELKPSIYITTSLTPVLCTVFA